MTGRVCEHCSTSVRPGDTVCRDGYSYHKKCHKCYVCSETNLHDAEVFRGVMFCNGCAKRIFRGCASARVARPARAQRRAQERLRRNIESSVLERARAASSSGVSSPGTSKMSTPAHRAPVHHDCYCVSDVIAKARRLVNFMYHRHDLCQIENPDLIPVVAPSTEACERMLKALSLPVAKRNVPAHPQPTHKRTSSILKTSTSDTSSGRVPRRRRSAKVKVKEEVPCSDLRIAELGASTEIATMALRKTSTKKVNPQSKLLQTEEMATISMFSNIESVMSHSHTSHEEFLDSECEEYRGSNESDRDGLDHNIGIFFKIPYAYFKRKILQRSSLISVIAEIDSEKESVYKRFKMLFHEDKLNRRRNGYKKLYPTINKRNQYKLGWLDPEQSGDHKPSPCKHFHECDSYRCMREQVMRLAGPTKSKIAVIQSNIKKVLMPWFLRNVSIQFKNRAMKSTACGKSASAVVSRLSN